MQTRIALIIGASGLVGGHCLDALLKEETYSKIIALVRTPLKRSHSKVIQKIIDFDRIQDFTAEIKADDIYCCLGTTFLKSPCPKTYYKIDFEYCYNIAKIAVENNARQFALVSALSANPKGLFFYSRVKGKLEQAIERLPYDSVYIMRPSYLMGERQEFRPIEKMGVFILKILSPILFGPLRFMRPIAAKTVAETMVQLCLKNVPGIHIYESDQIQKKYDSFAV